MTDAVVRKLVFRLGGVAFSLELTYIVEICEQVAEIFDSTCTDPGAGIIGALEFRNTRVPAIDPALGFGLPSRVPYSARTALILNSSEGSWALLVDRVEEISQAGRFQPLNIPPLLKGAIAGAYSRIELYNNEPVVCFDPERFYGVSGPAV